MFCLRLEHHALYPCIYFPRKSYIGNVSLSGFPGIIGAIDGSHIEIEKPHREPDAWNDRHGKHSINLTAVCDSDGKIIYYNVGAPGSFHDARVLRLSDLPDLLCSLPDQFHIIGELLCCSKFLNPIVYDLVTGDSAYGITKQLLVPYPNNGHLSDSQTRFNFHLSSNRIIIENCFAHLKNRFKRIHTLLKTKSLERATVIIRACIHLHNYITITTTSQPESETLSDSYLLPVSNPASILTGRDKRNHICAHLYNQ